MGTNRMNHIQRQIPPLAHTAMYVWHKYWGRKTWNVVSEFVKAYCPAKGVVFDPFSGSGVVAIEAIRAGRRAIVCDLLPIATEITRLTLKPFHPDRIVSAFERVASNAKQRILTLYMTACRQCGHVFPIPCAVWKNGVLTEIRYPGCPRCGDRRERNCPPSKADLTLLRRIARTPITAFYPTSRLFYPDGTPFKEKQKFDSIPDLFTRRNLLALSWLMEAIDADEDGEAAEFLRVAFTSMVHLVSKMTPVSDPSAKSKGHHTYFSSPGWTQHSYWSSAHFKEQNVWERFEDAVTGNQGIIRAKTESNRELPGIRFGRSFQDVLAGKADIYIHTGDSLDLMGRMTARGATVDYIFTDPPYDAAVQYGELSLLWNAWLRRDTGFVDMLVAKEIVRNERQGKPSEVYQALMQNVFKKMHDLLRPDAYLTVTFHNPSFKVRNATIQAGVLAGFDLQKIHHQPLGQVSAKAMLQPFGSAQGDFYLRFLKSRTSNTNAADPGAVDASRFERVVVETAKRVLAERGEETPYTILLNAIDPELARRGYFSQLLSGLDVQTVLTSHLGNEFVLVPMRLGETEGKAWWFRDAASVPHLQSIPLSDRVEQTVLRRLQGAGRVTFTDMWKAVSEEFPNSLTTDSTTIREALAMYAKPVGSAGEWLLKPEFDRNAVRRSHTRIVAIVAEVGKARGLEIWIGKREQRDRLNEAFPSREGTLKKYLSRTSLIRVKDLAHRGDVEQIDVLWLQDDRVVSAFEIESTTSMTEALKRGSNLPSGIHKFMIIPSAREAQLDRKLKSPLFADRFRDDSWRILFFEAVETAFAKSKGELDLEALVRKGSSRSRKTVERRQLDFFGSSETAENEVNGNDEV